MRAGWTAAQRHVSLALLRHRAVESAVSTVVVRGSLALVDGGGFAKNERELLALRLAVVLVLEGGRLSRNGHAPGLVLRIGQDICLIVPTLPGQPAQELAKLVLELPRHDGRLLVAELIGGEAVPLEVLVLEPLKKLGDSLLQPHMSMKPREVRQGRDKLRLPTQ